PSSLRPRAGTIVGVPRKECVHLPCEGIDGSARPRAVVFSPEGFPACPSTGGGKTRPKSGFFCQDLWGGTATSPSSRARHPRGCTSRGPACARPPDHGGVSPRRSTK